MGGCTQITNPNPLISLLLSPKVCLSPRPHQRRSCFRLAAACKLPLHFAGGASTNLKVRSNTSNTTTAEKYAETFSFFPPRPLCSAEPLKKIRLAENALKVFSRAETWLFFLPRASSRFLPRASGIRDAGRRSATKRIADQPQPRQ